MANLQSLAKDTAIYGISSIVGRFLNYLLVPLYTAKLSAASGGYGIITNIYAYTALLLIILTYGMETTFFRYVNKEGEKQNTVYSTILLSVAGTSILFIVLVTLFLSPLANFMGYAEHSEYVWIMFTTVAFDAFQCIPFAYLRYKNKALKFAALKMLFIVLNIFGNLLFFLLLPALYESHPDIVSSIYNPRIGVGYAFYVNIVCTVSITPLFFKELTGFHYTFDKLLLKRMLGYSWPILLLGVTGILSQAADKILYPYLDTSGQAHSNLGIYGAASKIAMVMVMIAQAFRYAYEPFVFSKAKERDSLETYASIMKYFIIFTLLAFLFVVGFLDVFKYIIARDYWCGLFVVPIVMAGEIMYGVYFNLSFWYKLTDRTIWGAVFSGIGCFVLLVINIVFVPEYGYAACAWGSVGGYGTAMLLSYFVGQKYYPINYPLRSIFSYVLIAVVFVVAMMLARHFLPVFGQLACNSVLLLIFVGYILHHDFPISKLLVVGKYFKHK